MPARILLAPLAGALLAPLAGALLAFALPLGALAAVEVERVADINQQGAGSFPRRFTTLGSTRFFTAFTSATGRELYVSRGGADDTALVSDISPGRASTTISNQLGSLQPAVLGGQDVLVFKTDGELWRTDGTDAGTFPIVTDVEVFQFAAVPALELVVFGGDDGVTGQEPWITDGTPGAEQQLKDVNPGPAGIGGAATSVPPFVVSDDRIYFPANDGSNGTELWTSDGTETGTVRVDVLVDDNFESGSFRHFEPDGAGGTYFTADGDSNGVAELWFSADGTAGTTAQVPYDGAYDTRTPVGAIRVLPSGAVYFKSRAELFLTDRTTTQRVTIDDGASTLFVLGDSSNARLNVVEFDPPSPLRSLATHALGRPQSGSDDDLWRIEGAKATEALSNTGSGTGSLSARGLTAAGGRLFFAAGDSSTGLELWSSDGTAAGTAQVTEIAAGPAPGIVGISRSGREPLTATPTGVIFAGFEVSGGVEPWFSNGTAAGTGRIADLRPGTGDAYPFGLAAIGDAILFSANDGENGREPWRIDDSGTALLKDIYTGAPSSRPGEMIALGDKLYFAAETGSASRELWETDGTAAGTQLLKDVAPGLQSGDPAGLTRLGDRILFRACCDSTGQPELWVTDGSTAGTSLLADINPSFGSFPDGFARIGTRVYFGADDGATGDEPWRSDGTAAGTVRIGDVETGPDGSRPLRFRAVGDKVYFLAEDSVRGVDPRVYDPQTDSVMPLADIDGRFTRFISPALPLSTGDAVYFGASDDTSGFEPWVTDGTPGGTRRIRDIAAGAEGSQPFNFTEYQGAVYFSATEPATGRELYRYDPTTDSLARITDLASGPADGLPDLFETGGRTGGREQMLVADGRLFFAGRDSQTDLELWSTDGTTAGTRREADIVPGTDGSAPLLRAVIDDTLYFVADDGQTGNELWRATPVSGSGSGGSGDSGSGGGGGGAAGIVALLLLGLGVLAGGPRRRPAGVAGADV